MAAYFLYTLAYAFYVPERKILLCPRNAPGVQEKAGILKEAQD